MALVQQADDDGFIEKEELQSFGSTLAKILTSSAASAKEVKQRKRKIVEEDGKKGKEEEDEEMELPEGKLFRKRKMERQKEKELEIKTAERRKERFKNAEDARSVPDAATDLERERKYTRIATKAAVSLFNAVAKHQKEAMDEEMRPKQAKQTKVSKEDFMEKLKAGHANEEQEGEESDDGEEMKGKEWGIFDDEFSVKAGKLKDWDRDEVEDSDEEMMTETLKVRQAKDSEDEDEDDEEEEEESDPDDGEAGGEDEDDE